MQKNISQIVQETKDDAKSFLLAKKELLKLQALEKGVPASVLAVYMSILIFNLAICGAFALLCGAFALSIPFAQEMNRVPLSLTIGFGIMAGIFLLIALIMLALRGPVCRKISSAVLNKQLDKMDNAENIRHIQQQILKAEDTLAEERTEERRREKHQEAEIEPIVYEQF